MLSSARKLSQKDSFTVFDDSQLDESGAAALPEKRDIEVQTDLAFVDRNEATDIAFPVEETEEQEIEEDPATAFWEKAAAMQKANLKRLREENSKLEAQIFENKEKKKAIEQEYEELFEKLASALEESA